MNSRLQQFLRAENITQAQFADNIGVARASVSHILAGRNKPGFDFLENMSRHYPTLNIGWLITGKGRMYAIQNPEKQADAPAPQLFPAPAFQSQGPVAAPSEEPATIQTINLDKSTQTPNNERSINKILVFYSDNTFEEFKSRTSPSLNL